MFAFLLDHHRGQSTCNYSQLANELEYCIEGFEGSPQIEVSLSSVQRVGLNHIQLYARARQKDLMLSIA